MIVEQRHWTVDEGWKVTEDKNLGQTANLVLVFGGRGVLGDQSRFDEIKAFYPNAITLFGSTAGEIIDTFVYDDTITTTAVYFEHTKLESAQLNIDEVQDSIQAGKKLAEALPKEGLVHVFVVSDGLKVNGSHLVDGLRDHLPDTVSLTGGLAGDGSTFEKTLVSVNEVPTVGNIVLVGLYGDRLQVGYGSLGGWDTFGPERTVTRSEKNVLFELDGKSALALYKEYLGDQASGLPATGLLFPLSLWEKEGDDPIVRTILAVNEEDQSMTFAGNLPVDSHVRLMKANFDRLVDGASGAASKSLEAIGSTSPDLAILVSCVGRKLVLTQRIEEEVEGVRDVIGEHAIITGFYSYGEISPFTASPQAMCQLHNQTMTITIFSEK